MQTNSPVPRITQFQHDTPQAVLDLVDRALAKHPSLRFPNAVALLTALENLPIPRRPATGEWRAISAQPTIPPGSLTPSGGIPNPRSVGLTSEMNPITGPGDATLIDGERTLHRQIGSGPLINEKEDIYAYLTCEKAGEPPQEFPLKEKYAIIGRVDPKRGLIPDIDLSALDTTMTVSRQHARIRYEKTFFYIEDLKSRNKTRLGHLVLTPLKPELIQHGDVVHFGSVRMVFRVPGMQDMPTPKPVE